jgi:hypothetical protein
MKILVACLCIYGATVLASDKKDVVPDKQDVAPVGVVFTDHGSLELTLVRYGPEENHVFLVKIDGVDDPSNGKVVKVTMQGGGTSATYYKLENDRNLLRAPAHQYFGWEAYFGSKTYKIDRDGKKTKELKTAEILSAFNNQTKKGASVP